MSLSRREKNARRRRRRRLEKRFPNGHCDFCEDQKHYTALHCDPRGLHAAHRICFRCVEFLNPQECTGETVSMMIVRCPFKMTEADFVLLALARESVPPMLFIPKVKIDSQTLAMIENFNKQFRGALNAHKILILENE